MSDARSIYRVAVTVFCEAKGVDERDAGHVAEFAIRQALGGGTSLEMPYNLPPVVLHRLSGDLELPSVRVHDVIETGMAAGNGDLWLRPTSRAYHRVDR